MCGALARSLARSAIEEGSFSNDASRHAVCCETPPSSRVRPQLDTLFATGWKLPLPIMFANMTLAFSLNFIGLLVISRMSAIAYVLSGIVKVRRGGKMSFVPFKCTKLANLRTTH